MAGALGGRGSGRGGALELEALLETGEGLVFGQFGAACLGDGTERALKIAQDSGFATVLDAMFPERGQPSTPARLICSTCPVARDCLNYALGYSGERGMWAGTSYRQRSGMHQLDPEELEVAIDKHLRSLHQAPRQKYEPAACGTPSGYRKHRRNDEKPCEECTAAERAAARRRAQKKRAAKEAEQ